MTTTTRKASGFHSIRIVDHEPRRNYHDIVIELDGMEITGCRKVSIDYEVGCLPKVTLELHVNSIEYASKLAASDVEVNNVIQVHANDIPEGTYLIGETTSFDQGNRTFVSTREDRLSYPVEIRRFGVPVIVDHGASEHEQQIISNEALKRVLQEMATQQ